MQNRIDDCLYDFQPKLDLWPVIVGLGGLERWLRRIDPNGGILKGGWIWIANGQKLRPTLSSVDHE
jgi:hypothetical protein